MDKITNLTNITNIKLTSARKSILELLINSNKPLSYEDMKDNISMDKATFYRNITIFEEENIEIALFSAGGSVSAEFAPSAVEAGAVVIDNTSHFRMFEDVPLVVPEVNPEDIKEWRNRGIIANPNCSTIQMVQALKPLDDPAKDQDERQQHNHYRPKIGKQSICSFDQVFKKHVLPHASTESRA